MLCNELLNANTNINRVEGYLLKIKDHSHTFRNGFSLLTHSS